MGYQPEEPGPEWGEAKTLSAGQEEPGPEWGEPGITPPQPSYGEAAKVGLKGALSEAARMFEIPARAAMKLTGAEQEYRRTQPPGEPLYMSEILEPTVEEQQRVAQLGIPGELVAGVAGLPGAAVKWAPIMATGPFAPLVAGGVKAAEEGLAERPIPEIARHAAEEAAMAGVFRYIHPMGRLAKAAILGPTFGAQSALENYIQTGSAEEAGRAAIAPTIMGAGLGLISPKPRVPPPTGEGEWQGPINQYWQGPMRPPPGREPQYPVPYRIRRGRAEGGDFTDMYQDENGVWRAWNEPGLPPGSPAGRRQPPPTGGGEGGVPPWTYRTEKGFARGPGFGATEREKGPTTFKDFGTEPVGPEPYVTPGWVREGRTQPPPQYPPAIWRKRTEAPYRPPEGPRGPTPPEKALSPEETVGKRVGIEKDLVTRILDQALANGGRISVNLIRKMANWGAGKAIQLLNAFKEVGYTEIDPKTGQVMLTDKVPTAAGRLRYVEEIRAFRESLDRPEEGALELEGNPGEVGSPNFDIRVWLTEHGGIKTTRNLKTRKTEAAGMDMSAFRKTEGAKGAGKYWPFKKPDSGEGQSFDALFQELQAEGYGGTIDDAVEELQSAMTQKKEVAQTGWHGIHLSTVKGVIDRALKGRKLSPDDQAVWEEVKKDARENFRDKIHQMRLERKRALLEQLEDEKQPDPIDEWTSEYEDEIMGFKEELREEGWEEDAIERAANEARARYETTGEAPDYEAIKKAFIADERAEQTRLRTLSPIKQRQYLLPGQKVGLPFPTEKIPGGRGATGPLFEGMPPEQRELFGRGRPPLPPEGGPPTGGGGPPAPLPFGPEFGPPEGPKEPSLPSPQGESSGPGKPVIGQGNKIKMGGIPAVILGVDEKGVRIRLLQWTDPRAFTYVRPEDLEPYEDPTVSFARAAGSIETFAKGGEEEGELVQVDPRLIDVLGASMYKDNLAYVTNKELVQNAFDTVKEAAYKKVISPKASEVLVDLNPTTRTITVTDNGMGMTEEVLRKAFFTIGGSVKDIPFELRSGGLGMAKMAFELGSEWVEVTTTQPKSGITLRVRATPREIKYQKYKVQRESAPKNAHGTTVRVKLPETFVDSNTGATKDIYFPTSLDYVPFFQKPLIGDVKITQTESGENPRVLPLGAHQDLSKTPFLTTTHCDWGDIDIYFGIEKKDTTKWYGEGAISHEVLSSGVHQFSTTFQNPLTGDKVPYDVIVNVKSKVDTTHPNYPFTLNRNEFREMIKKDIQAMTFYLLDTAQGKNAEGLRDEYKNVNAMPRVGFNREQALTPEQWAQHEREWAEWKKGFEQREKSREPLPPPPKEVWIRQKGDEAVVQDKSGKQLGATQKDRIAEASFKAEKEAPAWQQFLEKNNIDPKKPIFHNNTNVDWLELWKPIDKQGREIFGARNPQKFFSELGSLFAEMKEVLAMSNLYGMHELRDNFFTGVSIDKSYGGVHIKVPYGAVFINPLNDISGSSTAMGLAETYLTYMTHELGHTGAMSHGVGHNQQQMRVRAYLADQGLLEYFQTVLKNITLKNWPLIQEMRRVYEQSSTKNTSKSFKGAETAEIESEGDAVLGGLREAGRPQELGAGQYEPLSAGARRAGPGDIQGNLFGAGKGKELPGGGEPGKRVEPGKPAKPEQQQLPAVSPKREMPSEGLKRGTSLEGTELGKAALKAEREKVQPSLFGEKKAQPPKNYQPPKPPRPEQYFSKAGIDKSVIEAYEKKWNEWVASIPEEEPVVFDSDNMVFVLTRDTLEPGKWRVSEFSKSDRMPWGHEIFDTKEEALRAYRTYNRIPDVPFEVEPLPPREGEQWDEVMEYPEGLKYNGIQKMPGQADQYVFTETTTGSTFYSDSLDYAHLEKERDRIRGEWKAVEEKKEKGAALPEKAPWTPDQKPVVRVVESTDPQWQDQNLGNAGWVGNGLIETVHVTDDPQVVIDTLKKGKSVLEGREEGKFGDLGKGLYGSGIPQIWVSRARWKWDFLFKLSPEQIVKLTNALENHPNMTEPGYLAQHERDVLKRDVQYVREGKMTPEILVHFADQPYNIRFWEPEFLKPLGIKPGPQPKEVPMVLKGKFAELNRMITDEESEYLAKQGYDGAFVRGNMVNTPQIVVWNNDAILKFGTYEKETGPPKTIEEFKNWQFPVPQGGASKTPKTVFGWRANPEEMGETLADLAKQGDTFRFNQALGIGPENAWQEIKPVAGVPERVKNGQPITVYRVVEPGVSTDIIPGAYVTESKDYAIRHGEEILKGEYELKQLDVYPDELMTYDDPHEFIYVPRTPELAWDRYQKKGQWFGKTEKEIKAEERKQRQFFLDEKEKAVVTSPPGAVPWPTADSLEIAREWYNNGKHGPALSLYRTLVNARSLGQEIHPNWYNEFPDLKDVQPVGRRIKLPKGKLEMLPEVPEQKPYIENGLIRTTFINGQPVYGGGPGTHAGDVDTANLPPDAKVETGWTIASEWDPTNPRKGFMDEDDAAKYIRDKVQDLQPKEPPVVDYKDPRAFRKFVEGKGVQWPPKGEERENLQKEFEAGRPEGETPKVGRAYVRSKGRESWRVFTDSEDITRGKNKGKVRVTLTDGRKIIVDKADTKEFRLGERPEEPLSREAVDAFAQEKLKTYKNAPDIEILDFDDIPDRLIAGANENILKGIKGIYDPLNRKIYLIRDMLGSDFDVISTIEHEVVGHFAMDAILGKNSEPFFEQVYMKYGKKGLSDIAGERGYDLNSREGRIKAAREKVAQLSENGENPGLLKRFYAWVREQVRKVFPKLKLSDAEIQAKLKQARDFLGRDEDLTWRKNVENLKSTVMNDPMYSLRASLKATVGKVAKAGYQEELKPRGKAFKDIWDGLKHALAPTRGVDVRDLNSLSRMLGDRERGIAEVEKRTEDAIKYLNKMSREQQIDLVDRIQMGLTSTLPPELQEIAKLHRTIEDSLWKTATIALGHLDEPQRIAYLEDHVRNFWKVLPKGSLEEINRRGFTGLWRRPLEGTKAPLHHQYWTLKEGMDHGGIPFTTNLIEMTRLNYADTMKLITANRMWDALLDTGHRQFIKWNEQVPVGFVPINDRIANKYFPRKNPKMTLMTDRGPRTMTQYEAELRRTALSDPNPQARTEAAILLNKWAQGWRPKEFSPGRWVVEENAARLLNNYLSRDLVRENPFLRGIMAIKNMTTALELGFSAFHASFITWEAIASQLELGMRKIWNQGMIEQGLKDILEAPTSFVGTYKIGRNILRYFKDPEGFAQTTQGKKFLERFPDAAEAMDHLFWGGGSVRMNEAYKISSLNVFKENLNSKNYIGAAFRSIPAMSQWVMKPLFENYIPGIKRAVFFKEFSNEVLARQADIAMGKITKAEIARDIWHFVENRFGEMNFDNLWWNRTMKSGLQLAIRSVTWKLGNIRGYGKAATGQSMELFNAMKERRFPKLTREMAWVWGLGIVTATMASVVQYMFTGKNPESWKDLVYPQIDNQGGRISLPTYMRDIFHMFHAPVKYITSSMAGWVSRFLDVIQNKDFYGVQVHDPNESKIYQRVDDAIHMLPLPFSVSSFKRMKEEGETPFKQSLGFFGGTKAPYWIERTHAEMKASELKAGHLPVAGRTPADFERGRLLKMYARQYQEAQLKNQSTDEILSALHDDIRAGKLFMSDLLRFRERVRYEPLISSVQHLPFKDVMEVWKVSNADERQKLYPILMRKFTGLRNIEDRIQYFPKMREIKDQLGGTP